MKKLTIGLSLAAMAIAGTAYAQQQMPFNPDATITRAEAQEHAAKMFGRLDVNGDGKIDKADREARREKMFDKIDTDHNGVISRAEFMAMHRPDGDADGRGGPGEPGRWGHMRGHRHGHMRGPQMMMARMADTNKDGAISKAEFMAAAMSHFDKMDTNHDGKVTKEERQAARAAMRAQWKDRMGGAMGGPGNPPPPPPSDGN